MSRGVAGHHSRGLQVQTAFDLRTWREQQLGRREPIYCSELFRLGCPPLASFIAAFLGCQMTLHLSASGLSPLVASATTTLLLSASLILTRTADLVPSSFFSSAYGGSFVGMTPVPLLGASVAQSGLPVDASFTLLSMFCGVVFSLGCALDLWLRGGLARGYGGRLGALAAVASFLFVGLAPLFGAKGEMPRMAHMVAFEQGVGSAALTFASCSAGMFVTMAVLRWSPIALGRRSLRIFASAAVAFVGLLILQQIAPDAPYCLDAYYAGCFLGMSSPLRLSGVLQSVSAAILLTTVLILTGPILPAVGGSLGYAAFVSVAFVDAAVRLFVAVGESSRHTLIAATRGLAAALAILSVLLPSELLLEHPPADQTGSIDIPATLVDPPAAQLLPSQADSPPVTVDSSQEPPAIDTPADLPWQILRPDSGQTFGARGPGDLARGSVPPLSAESSRRGVRHGQNVKHGQARPLPPPATRPHAVSRYAAQPLQEWQPDPSTLGAP